MRRLGIILGLCLPACGVIAAAGVWEAKPFTDWTDKETQLVLTDSPWAGKGSLTNVQSGGGFRPVPDWKVTVVWRTALPIRQALVRQLIGQGGKVTTEQQAMLDLVDQNYIVMVQGLPAMYSGLINAIGPQTTLERDGKAPIVATQGLAQLFDKNGNPMEAPARGNGAPPSAGAAPPAGSPAGAADGGGGGRGGRGGGRGGGGFGGGGFGGPAVKDDGSTATLMFGFPKADPITAADKDVEFSTTIGPYHLKHKFHPKDMVLKGEPAL